MLLVPISTLWFLGCGLASPITPAATSKSPFWFPIWGDPEMLVSEVPEGEQFRISHRGGTGFVTIERVRRGAQARAVEFCESKGRAMTAVSEQTSSHPHILGNFPRVEIIFVCTESVSAAQPSPDAAARYENLARLKELLDTGAITQKEFDREKSDLLK
jgi:hypothetical protein